MSDCFEFCETLLTYLFGHVRRTVDANKCGGCCELSNNTCCSDRSPAAVVRESWSTKHFTELYFRSEHPQWNHHTEETKKVSKENNALKHGKALRQEGVEAGSEDCDGDSLKNANVSG